MGSIFSYKAEDRTPIYQNPSFKYDAITNSDPIFPKEEANDKTKEDEVHIPVEGQQEKDQVKKQEEENDEDMADEVKLEVEKKEEEGNQEGSSKETEASRDSHLARLLSNATKCRLRLRSDVLGDGNCYFRALADQLKRVGLLESVNTTSHEKLREGICDYMQYYPIPEMAYYVSPKYISDMRQNHKWAGEPEIVATKKKYGVNIKVVTSAACSTANKFYKHYFSEENATKTLYFGHIHEKHYVSLEPDDDQDLTKDRGAMSSAGKLKGSHGGTDATQGKLKGSHGETDATQGKLKGSHGGTDATPGNQEGSSEGAEASTATNQVDRPVPQQENWRVHMEELKRHQEQWRVHMDGLMEHQEQWRVHMDGLMEHQEQWMVYMDGLMKHQEIQTSIPAPPGDPEGQPASTQGDSKGHSSATQGGSSRKSCCCRVISALVAVGFFVLGKLKGLCGWTDDTTGEIPTKICRVVSGGLVFFFLAIGCVSIGLYLFCYIGDKEHYLRFFGHMSYRPSLVLAPLIVFLAACKTPEEPYTSWDNVFVLRTSSCKNEREALDINKCWAKLITAIIYILVASAVCGFKLAFFFTTPTQCGGEFLIVWLISEILGVCFFVFFCYFLYLQRLKVQDARKNAKQFFSNNVGKLKVCIKEINKFFQVYHPLRSVMLPLMYILLFESTFGIVIFLTWNYKHVDPPSGTSSPTLQPYWPIRTSVCPVNCPPIDFNHLKSSVLYNLWIVSRHIMTILLPYLSVSGMDMKYIWDDLRTDLHFSYSENHDSFRNKLTVYMEGLHPDTSTYTILNIIVPLMALAAGIFTVDQL